jgi:hypothetical protein
MNLKKILPILLLATASVSDAHDHVEVGLSSSSSTQLAIDGPAYQLATYVPSQEFFSSYRPLVSTGAHFAELTFTTETNAIDPAAGADPRIEVVSVIGPQNATFSFWEVGSTTPTWTRATGWNSSQSSAPSFPVIQNGDNHLHGRAFSADKPGLYQVTFRAVDGNGTYSTSANLTITFNAQQPPQLSIGVASGNTTLSFTSCDGLTYDLQVCTDLVSGVWTNVTPHTRLNGDGSVITMIDTMAGRAKAFYRLVEYY